MIRMPVLGISLPANLDPYKSGRNQAPPLLLDLHSCRIAVCVTFGEIFPFVSLLVLILPISICSKR